MASTLTHLVYHVVFSTKDRMPLIKPEFESELYPYIGGIVNKVHPKSALIAAGGVADHIHLLCKFQPAVSVAEYLQNIKGGSSLWMNEQNKLKVRFSWQEGYSAFSVSKSVEETVKQYIAKQKIHHEKTSFKDELRGLLEKHGIEYDEKYLW